MNTNNNDAVTIKEHEPERAARPGLEISTACEIQLPRGLMNLRTVRKGNRFNTVLQLSHVTACDIVDIYSVA
jgi:hypothetical protein